MARDNTSNSRTYASVTSGNGGCKCQISLSSRALISGRTSNWLDTVETGKQASAGRRSGEKNGYGVGKAEVGQTKEPAYLSKWNLRHSKRDHS